MLTTKNEFIQQYMRLVEDTESPRLFHVWSALLGVSACLGRRVSLPFGGSPILPNMYVLLIGTPGTRKSSAMGIMHKLLRTTSIRFAPQDTAGHRQGLVKAMLGIDEEIEKLREPVRAAGATSLGNMALEEIGALELSGPADKRDKHTMCVCSGEFSRFIGQNNLQMLDFLTTMYDGDPYDYSVGKEEGQKKMESPLLSILGCTTPISITKSMPPEAGGQGFLSRVVMVYGAKKYKSIARPKPFNPMLVSWMEERFARLCDFSGDMDESPAARELSIKLYEKPSNISDPRFVYYGERRYTHLLKLSMVMAASRLSHVIEEDDVREAEALLSITEKNMPDALGEYGMSPIAAAKQQILDFVRAAEVPIGLNILRAVMHRDLRMQELTQCISDLVAADQLHPITLEGQLCYIPRLRKQEETKNIEFLLTGNQK
jgi:hypothetical protein